MIRLQLLGSVELTNGDGAQAHSVLAQPKRVALLAYLAIARPRGFHRRDKLLALFWPDSDEAHARNALRQAIHFLRKALGAELVLSRGEGEIGLDRDVVWVDVIELERLVEEGSATPALELYRGGLMESFHVPGAADFDEWLADERRRLKHLAWQLAISASEIAAGQGRLEDAVPLARRAVAIRPLNEVSGRVLMALLSDAGDRAGALNVYARLENGLREEYDTDPELETVELVERIRQGDGEPALYVPEAGEVPSSTEPADARGAVAKGPWSPTRLGWAVGAVALVATYVVLVDGGPEDPRSEASRVASGWPTHVLWVDDLPRDSREVIAHLRDQGVLVTSVADARAALRVFDPLRHEVVVSDVGRQEGDAFDPRAGLELLEGLRAVSADARVVFYTSPRGVASAAEAALAGGAVGVSTEPDELLELLRSLAVARRGRVIMADFEASPGDEETARAFGRAMRVDLERSAHMLVVPRAHVNRALVRMEHPADTTVSADLAGEIARRDGYAAVVAGAVSRVAGGWVLTARATLPDGTPLFSARESVTDVIGMLPAIDRVSRRIREGLGESAATLRNRAPLPEVTTRSYPALLAYAAGMARMDVSDYGSAQEHFERAVAFDSTFAAAWAHLAVSHRNRSEWPQAIRALQRARTQRHRLTLWEQLRLDYQHAEVASGDMQAARAASDALLGLRPDRRDLWLQQRVLIAYHEGDWVEGEARAAELRDLLGGLPATSWWNLVALQLLNGHDAAADSSLDRWQRDLGWASTVMGARFRVAFQRQDWVRAVSILDEVGERNPDDRHGLDYWRALVALGAGQLQESDRRFDEWLAEETDVGQYRGAIEGSMWRALADIEVRRDTVPARGRLEEARPLLGGATAPAKIMFAWVAAAVGLPVDARWALEVYEATSSDFDLDRRPREYWAALGATQLAEGSLDEALRTLRRGREVDMGRAFECQFCPAMMLGRVHDVRDEPELAIPRYEEFVNARWVFGPDREQDAAFLVPVRERLAELYEERGEGERAAGQYREILRQWADADPQLQPRLDAAREGLARTSGDTR